MDKTLNLELVDIKMSCVVFCSSWGNWVLESLLAGVSVHDQVCANRYLRTFSRGSNVGPHTCTGTA